MLSKCCPLTCRAGPSHVGWYVEADLLRLRNNQTGSSAGFTAITGHDISSSVCWDSNATPLSYAWSLYRCDTAHPFFIHPTCAVKCDRDTLPCLRHNRVFHIICYFFWAAPVFLPLTSHLSTILCFYSTNQCSSFCPRKVSSHITAFASCVCESKGGHFRQRGSLMSLYF